MKEEEIIPGKTPPDNGEHESAEVNEKPSSPDALIVNNEPPSNNIMEVHHHGHVHEKKKWKEYLFQFLMLFLAVTAGFFVENRRDHYIEGLRAEEYAHALLKDIIKDTLELNKTIAFYQENIGALDTLQQLRKKFKSNIGDASFRYYGAAALFIYRVSFNEATLQQLKNSGNLRYFRNLKLKEKISDYDNVIRTFMLRQEIELTYVPSSVEFYMGLFNYDLLMEYRSKFHGPSSLDSLDTELKNLITKDTVYINRFLNFCYLRKSNWEQRIRANINPTLAIARELIDIIKKEYHFE